MKYCPKCTKEIKGNFGKFCEDCWVETIKGRPKAGGIKIGKMNKEHVIKKEIRNWESS